RDWSSDVCSSDLTTCYSINLPHKCPCMIPYIQSFEVVLFHFFLYADSPICLFADLLIRGFAYSAMRLSAYWRIFAYLRIYEFANLPLRHPSTLREPQGPQGPGSERYPLPSF